MKQNTLRPLVTSFNEIQSDESVEVSYSFTTLDRHKREDITSLLLLLWRASATAAAVVFYVVIVDAADVVVVYAAVHAAAALEDAIRLINEGNDDRERLREPITFGEGLRDDAYDDDNDDDGDDDDDFDVVDDDCEVDKKPKGPLETNFGLGVIELPVPSDATRQ
jgi:hypothetical protein